jgi:hypothetical protein
MSVDHLRTLSELIALALATVTAVRSGWGMWLRYRQNIEIIKAGGDPKSLPPLDERPLLWAAIFAGALAYLFAQHPQVAQRLLPSESAEITASAMPSPSAASCTSASDCRSGCACTGGQCTPCSALEKKPKTQPPQKKPRLVASMDGALCADCLRFPQFTTAIAQPFGE